MSHVRFHIEPPHAHIMLARPQALNALDHGMVRDVRAALEQARSDERVAGVVLTGEGGRAFCAGGDVRGVVLELRKGNSELARSFFRDEYALNHAIASFEKPWISIVDHIVMGGGAGISVHGSHRIATERTVFAMPETAIGFFPDVGASFFLPRCPGEIGTWLALTGARIGAGDLLAAGLATHVVDSVFVADVVDVARVLAAARTPVPTTLTLAHRTVIDRSFAFDHMSEIVAALERDGSVFARDALVMLRAVSPTSLVATLALLRAGRGRTLAECLMAEYRASQAFITDDFDFIEGVRAMLIDKDKAPKWRHARLEDVDEDEVRAAIARPMEPELAL